MAHYLGAVNGCFYRARRREFGKNDPFLYRALAMASEVAKRAYYWEIGRSSAISERID